MSSPGQSEDANVLTDQSQPVGWRARYVLIMTQPQFAKLTPSFSEIDSIINFEIILFRALTLKKDNDICLSLRDNVFYFRKTILIPTLAVILLSARHYQIASDCCGQVAGAL